MKLKLLFFTILISFCAHAQVPPFTLNGNAVQENCNTYRLTLDQAGQSSSIWNNTLIDLTNSFYFSFQVYLGKKGDSKGADGIAFVLQPLSVNLGTNGGGMGYEGITPSIGITIDTYQNSDQGDPDFNHICIQANGNIDHNSGDNLTDPIWANPKSKNIADGKWHDMTVKWDAVNEVLSTSIDGVSRLSLPIDLTNDIFSGLTHVFWGFTGSTGALSNLQKFRIALSPRFSYSGSLCGTKTDYQFVDSSYSFTKIKTYTWDFGDGSPLSHLQNPTHTFANPGTYNTKFVITDSSGCSDSITKPVIVKKPQPPVAKYTFLKDSLRVQFYGDSSDGVYLWSWDFGDRSNPSTEKNPKHVYLQPGSFTITLIVSNKCGSDTIQFDILLDNSKGGGGNTGVETNQTKSENKLWFYPNPFSESTKVRFELKESSSYQFEIYDLLGKRIFYLSSPAGQTGWQEISLTKNDLTASGIYFCKLCLGNKTITSRLILQ